MISDSHRQKTHDYVLLFLSGGGGGFSFIWADPLRYPSYWRWGVWVLFFWVVGVERINASVRIDGQLLLYMYGS